MQLCVFKIKNNRIKTHAMRGSTKSSSSRKVGICIALFSLTDNHANSYAVLRSIGLAYYQSH